MKLLRRNTTAFDYRAYLGEQETLHDGRHAGNFGAQYAEPVQKRGHISVPSGFATDQLFGIDTKYTHILLMDKIDPDIAEEGLIDWKGAVYKITAVRPSLNVLAVALKQQTENHPAGDDTDDGTGDGD